MSFSTMTDSIMDLSARQVTWLKRHSMYLLLVAAIMVGTFLGYSVYRWWAIARNERATAALENCIALHAKVSAEKAAWQELFDLSSREYANHSSSAVAPYFILYQVHALLGQNKKAEAYRALDTMVQQVATANPLYGGFALMKILVLLDLTDEERAQAQVDQTKVDQAVKQLDTLAHDKKNVQRESALYYLGLYYWSKNDISGAQKVWEELLTLEGSPYSALVQERLESLPSK